MSTLGIIILLYLRYIDDINLATIALAPGSYFDKNTQKISIDLGKVAEDKNIQKDIRTLKVLRDIADSIVPMLKWEFDTPSSHENERLPVLDLNIWLDGKDNTNKIKHSFYQREMTNKSVILAPSATPINMKKAILTEE